MTTLGDTPSTTEYPPLVLISEEVLAAAETSIDFSSIPQTYADLLIVGYLHTDRAANLDGVNLAFNADTTAGNYDTQYLQAVGTSVSGAFNAASREIGLIPGLSGNPERRGRVRVEIGEYASAVANPKVAHVEASAPDNPGVTLRKRDTTLAWKSAAAITSITLTPGIGTNFTAGSRAALYGIKGA